MKSYAPQGGTMTRATRAMAFAVCTVMLAPAFGSAQQVVGKGVEFTTPESIKWVKNAAGTQETAVLFGDPTEARTLRDAAPVAARQHEPPALPSRTIASSWSIYGTWWLGSGEKYDPESTVPVGPRQLRPPQGRSDPLRRRQEGTGRDPGLGDGSEHFHSC